MTTPFFQDVNPPVTPDPVTPQDSPGDPAGYSHVTPPGAGPAPYDISGPQDIAGITAAVQAAMSLSGGGEGADTGAGIPNRSLDSSAGHNAPARSCDPVGPEWVAR